MIEPNPSPTTAIVESRGAERGMRGSLVWSHAIFQIEF